ncbi:MAG TPA: hypothetical protein VGL56_10290 [Fimbriimonadaceae bacterium]|jgi:hypothetical protein
MAEDIHEYLPRDVVFKEDVIHLPGGRITLKILGRGAITIFSEELELGHVTLEFGKNGYLIGFGYGAIDPTGNLANISIPPSTSRQCQNWNDNDDSGAMQ